MAKVRFLGHEPHTVPELGELEVQPDQVVSVPDERFEAYVCQTSLWESVEEPTALPEPQAPKAQPAKKRAGAAATTTPEGTDD